MGRSLLRRGGYRRGRLPRLGWNGLRWCIL
ncbi:hypothetical protein LINPERHAP2_LOCUS8257 [Linum perenne]